MNTPRQKLLQALIWKLQLHNTKALLCEHGKKYYFAGHEVIYKTIRPDTIQMNELTEEMAKSMSREVWQYYLHLSDLGYKRLTRKAYRLS